MKDDFNFFLQAGKEEQCGTSPAAALELYLEGYKDTLYFLMDLKGLS